MKGSMNRTSLWKIDNRCAHQRPKDASLFTPSAGLQQKVDSDGAQLAHITDSKSTPGHVFDGQFVITGLSENGKVSTPSSYR